MALDAINLLLGSVINLITNNVVAVFRFVVAVFRYVVVVFHYAGASFIW